LYTLLVVIYVISIEYEHLIGDLGAMVQAGWALGCAQAISLEPLSHELFSSTPNLTVDSTNFVNIINNIQYIYK
jgi:hypothetical protein